MAFAASHDLFRLPPCRRSRPARSLYTRASSLLTLQILDVCYFDEGSVILRQDRRSEYLYMLHSGSASVCCADENGSRREVRTCYNIVNSMCQTMTTHPLQAHTEARSLNSNSASSPSQLEVPPRNVRAPGGRCVRWPRWGPARSAARTRCCTPPSPSATL